jgi:FMN phosphatase YigB (HAD superfamily)
VVRAVLFDVDFTLSRPGPELGPEGYRRLGELHGLTLDARLYETARAAAIADVPRHPELVHDEEIWILLTEEIIRGMGGDLDGARACAVDMVREWERHDNFSLYEDALPALEELRAAGLRIGLVSNGQPHPSIFEAALDELDVSPAETAMVGDSLEDDIEGARSLGIRAILLDRDGIYPEEPDRITDLFSLPAALGLVRQ